MTIFRWQFQKFVRRSGMALLDLLCGLSAVAWWLDFPAAVARGAADRGVGVAHAARAGDAPGDLLPLVSLRDRLGVGPIIGLALFSRVNKSVRPCSRCSTALRRT